MASPLLEAGAIDGARGILINITGSSSLKLSEVNEASSLIQSAAHEDANIIFGAVQDEKMGDEVKITVIATGFRDQMPERRARMLSVEEAPVVSVPLVSVPVVATENWLREPAAAPLSPRFQSQDEEEEEEKQRGMLVCEPCFFSAEALTAESAGLAAPMHAVVDAATELEHDQEPAAAGARPQFAEMAEEPLYTPLPKDYASDFGSDLRVPAARDEHRAQPAATLFSEPDEESLRELDTPTFMRRLQF
jgi:cell division protein FtsZ